MTNRTFTDFWTFRMIAPILSGTIIYLLILLINNSLEQLFGLFITDEFLVCIVIAFIVTECTRYFLGRISKWQINLNDTLKVLLTILSIVLMAIVLVSLGLSVYFIFLLGYLPLLSELQPFLILYSGLSIALASVYLSHYFIQRASDEMLAMERQLKVQSDVSFIKLTRGVNPDLLFETLECLITHIQDDRLDETDDMIDDFSLLYRYTLSQDSKEIISLHEELGALKSLSRLINRLPYRKTKVISELEEDGFIVPGSLLHIIEQIVKKTIVSYHKVLEVRLYSCDKGLCIAYIPHDKLNDTLNTSDIRSLNQAYKLYTDKEINIEEEQKERIVSLPILNMH